MEKATFAGINLNLAWHYRTSNHFVMLSIFSDYPHDVVVESDDTLLLPYSSGTTGLPKGIMLTHQNVVALNEISR